MGFVKGLSKGIGVLAFVGAGIAQPATAQSNGATNRPVMQAQAKAKAPAPTPAAERGPSNVELVNKALNPGASDPDVPLPHPDLANSTSSRPAQGTGPQIYGRQEEGGGVFGLRMPIPVDRSGSSAATRYGASRTGSESTSQTR